MSAKGENPVDSVTELLYAKTTAGKYSVQSSPKCDASMVIPWLRKR